jgi:hypothetical protein
MTRPDAGDAVYERERENIGQGPKQGRHPSIAEMQSRIGVLDAELAAALERDAAMAGLLRQRTRELEEWLEYQTATSDVLTVISHSTFGLQPVLDTVCETAARLCRSDGATIAMREGEVYRYASTYAIDDEQWEITRTPLFSLRSFSSQRDAGGPLPPSTAIGG